MFVFTESVTKKYKQCLMDLRRKMMEKFAALLRIVCYAAMCRSALFSKHCFGHACDMRNNADCNKQN